MFIRMMLMATIYLRHVLIVSLSYCLVTFVHAYWNCVIKEWKVVVTSRLTWMVYFRYPLLDICFSTFNLFSKNERNTKIQRRRLGNRLNDFVYISSVLNYNISYIAFKVYRNSFSKKNNVTQYKWQLMSVNPQLRIPLLNI